MGVSVTDTSNTLAVDTPILIAAASPGCSVFIISNTGIGHMVWKTKTPPTSQTDGTPLDPASASGGQGGVVVLTGADAIVDAIYAWSHDGTTCNVKQGTQRP